MIRFVFSPKWFYGIDSIFEILSFVVPLLIALFAYKANKFTKKEKYKYMALSFLMIGFSFLFKILTNITIYYDVLKTHRLGIFTFTYNVVEKAEYFYIAGYFFHRLLMLFGLTGILFTIRDMKQKEVLFLILYLIFVIPLFSNSVFFVYHITAAILIGLILIHFYKNYKIMKTNKKLLLIFSFSFILLSQVMFIFTIVNLSFYVAAEIFQLAGYVLLLLDYFSMVHKR